ncbi:3'-to-5' exoribonuclease RNase R [hydrothermal vent metagenome]|uniref:exoribonuclease II n=1 Tax=hydrothermal vent metagenome TaxID=652676 RepID=A0A3B1CBF1_9ZZZZ
MPLSDSKFEERLKALLVNPLSMREILTRLKIPLATRSVARKRVRAIAETGAVVRIKGGRYGLPEKMNLVTGTIQGHPDGFGFLIPDEPAENDVFLGPRSFNDAMHGDKVIVRVESTKPDGRREGRVIRVLERGSETIVGTFEKTRSGGYVVPFDRRVTHDIFIATGDSKRAKDGYAVIAEITDFPTKARRPQGKIVKVLGKKDDFNVEIEISAAKFKLRKDFPPAVLREAVGFKAPVEKDFKGRLDLRDKQVVTIDGETAKDFDDAVDIEKLSNGGWRLGVHIADVSHYVKEGAKLDVEAMARATSVYFPGAVIPMLPFELSNDLCSLNPKVARLTLSCVMTFSRAGVLKKSEYFESVICSAERMTYTDVAAILEKKDETVISKYKGLVKTFKEMEKLATAIRRQRQKGGAIDFDLPEPEIILDVTGRPESIILAERNVAHRIIEEFMLAANSSVAHMLENSDLPAMYRVHDAPDPVKLEAFREFLGTFGMRLKSSEKITSKKMQGILAHFAGKPEEKLVTHVLLRSMKQARYSIDNIGHFGLAFDHYTHFTSPIRRYPDLVVHRLLKKRIRKKGKTPDAEVLAQVADHASKMERNADEAERDMLKLRQTQYMAAHVGDEFDGIISGVTAFGFFVELQTPPVEGLVRVTSLFDDYYIYDETRHALTGERSGKVFRLGDSVRVLVENVLLERRQIELLLVTAGKKTVRRPAGRKKAPKTGRPQRKGSPRRKKRFQK